jgi:N-acetylneuraminic acid mutarotase
MFNSVSASDVVEDSWYTKASMNYPRSSPGIVAVDGKIYVIGGDQTLTVSTTKVDFNERYDPKTNKWTILAPMPTPSSGFKAVACSGKIYCIGRGLNEVYDIAANSWSIKTAYPGTANPVGVHVLDGKIFVVLYSFNASVGCELYMYDPDADSWVAKTSLPGDCLVTSPFVMDGQLMVTGTFIDPVHFRLLTYDLNADRWSDGQIISAPLAGSVVLTSGVYAPQKIYIPQTLNRTAQHIDLSSFSSDFFLSST